jgi:DNA-binding beta-propeller fold protein YncE
MKTQGSIRWIVPVLLLCVPFSGGQTKPGSKKETPQASQAILQPQSLIWPPPPDPPRVRWLAQYTDMAKVRNSSVKKRGWLDKVTGTRTPEERLELHKPYGIATDSRGRIYAADTDLKTVFVIDPAAKQVERREGSSRAPMAMPAGVAVDAQDRLFVSDAQLRSITCFSPTGELVARFGTSALGRPGGIAIDPQRNRLYVADAKENRIAAFNTRTFDLTGYIGAASKSGKAEEGTFASPTNVAVDRQGNLYVADTLNYRIQVLSPVGKFIRTFGMQGDRPGEFIRPKGIAVDSEGHIYVADAEFNNFQVLSQEGRPLLAVGTLGNAPGEFSLIAGLHIDSQDRIYTTEMFIGRIQVFQYIPPPASAERKGVIRPTNQ